MYKQLLRFSFVLIPFLSFAQSRQENYFSVTLGGGITGASLSSSINALPPNSTQNIRFNYSAHAWYNYLLNNKWALQTGLGYTDVGFRRQQNNLKLGDKTFPGIGSGIIIDATNIRKDINYDYRFHYIQVPVWFNYQVYRSKDFRSNYMITGGITADVLLKHFITARLNNFTVDEDKKFQLDSTGMKGSAITANLSLGARLEHKLDKTITLIIHPMFNFYPLSITTSSIEVRPYSLMLHAGIIINLPVKGDK